MGIYFCRVGTDDGADTEPGLGVGGASWEGSRLLCSCFSRVCAQSRELCTLSRLELIPFLAGIQARLLSVFASHQSVFACGVCDQNLDDRTTTTIIILISFTCFSSLRQMMDLSTEAAQVCLT
ncbi:hypothetical protein BDL97_19G017400 [Sphagnum fallax]|nr:hypothetical protein BDL97_19G017400 [Sphagnum fallax]